MGNRKVGIMGGTFNPIHYGHLLIAENALYQYQLDEICFIPAGIPPHKQTAGITDGKTRCKMVSLAIEDNPKFTISDMEVISPQTSYTYRTLEYLKENWTGTDLYFIMGADSLHDFHTWKYPDRICELCHLLVAVRDEIEISNLAKIAEMVRSEFHANVSLLHTPNMEISSNSIRNRVHKQESIRYLVPERVRDFILENNLYV